MPAVNPPAASAILPKEVIAHLSLLKRRKLSRDRSTVTSAWASSTVRSLEPLSKKKICLNPRAQMMTDEGLHVVFAVFHEAKHDGIVCGQFGVGWTGNPPA